MLSAAERLRPTWLAAAAFAGMFQFGIVMALLGAILPLVSEKLEINLARTGTLFLGMNFAMLAASLVVGPLMDRFGLKPPLAGGPLLVSAALLWVGASSSFESLLGSLALLGVGGAALNGSTNTLIADLYDDPRRKNAMLNLLGIFFGFGAVTVPFLIGLLIEATRLTHILQGGAALGVAIAAAAALPAFPPAKQAHALRATDVGRLLREPLVLFFGAMLFFQSGNEFTMGGYTTTYLTKTFGSTVQEASYILAAYWGAVMAARVVLSRLLLRVPGEVVVASCAAASGVAAAALCLAPTGGAAAAAAILTGFALAGIFPTVLGLAGARFPGYSGTVIGLLLAMALTGGMSVPWVVGQASAVTGLRGGLALVVAGFLAIFSLALVSRKLLRSR